MHHDPSSSDAVTAAILATCLALAQPGTASAADAPARARDPVNVSGQFKGAKDAVQKISDALPQPLYDAIKSRNLSLMVYTKNFTFSNTRKNWCWAYVGITTPTPNGRAERLAPGATTSVFSAYFSDRGRPFQADRGRRNGVAVAALGKRAGTGLTVHESSTISLKRAAVGCLSGLVLNRT